VLFNHEKFKSIFYIVNKNETLLGHRKDNSPSFPLDCISYYYTLLLFLPNVSRVDDVSSMYNKRFHDFVNNEFVLWVHDFTWLSRDASIIVVMEMTLNYCEPQNRVNWDHYEWSNHSKIYSLLFFEKIILSWKDRKFSKKIFILFSYFVTHRRVFKSSVKLLTMIQRNNQLNARSRALFNKIKILFFLRSVILNEQLK
jgi:hypothetical protein